MKENEEQPISHEMCPHGNFPGGCEACAQKRDKWDAATQKTEKITDAIGKEIDPGIKESVIGLLAHDFPTDQSCEGHLRKGAIPNPWVRVGVEIPKEAFKDFHEKTTIEEAKKMLAQYIEQNRQIRERLVPLIEKFNEGRDVDPQIKLEAAIFNMYDHSVIQPVGAEEFEKVTDEKERGRILELSRKEMNDFAAFLKEEFFSQP